MKPTSATAGAPPPARQRGGRGSFLADLKFSYKILSLPLLAALSFTLVLLVVLASGRKNEALMAEIDTGHFPALMLRRDLEERLAAVQRALQDAAGSRDEELIAETDAISKEILERIRGARGNTTLDAAELRALETAFGEYYSFAAETTRKMIQGGGGSGLTAELGRMTASYTAIRDLLAKNTTRQKAAVEQAFQEARRNQTNSLRISSGIILLCLALLVALSLILTRTLTRALRSAVNVAGRIAEGDLSVSFDDGQRVTRDEVGTMLASLRTMTENLRGMLFQVKQSSQEVFGASSEMSAAYSQIRAGADTQAALSQESSAVIEEMAASIRSVAGNAVTMAGRAETTGATIAELGSSIQSVARNTESLSAAVEQTSASIEEMGASIGEISRVSQVQLDSARETEEGMRRIAETIRLVGESLREAERIAGESRNLGQEGAAAARRANTAMQQVTVTVRRTADSIREVNSHSSEIESILGVIEEIADQTNLLALNAAILAAQAGEHGRGFSVVAEEVRELANRSMTSAREVGRQIRTIIVKTRDAVAVAEETLRETEESATHTHVAGAALDKIVAGTDRTAEIVSRINDSGREQGRISVQAMETARRLAEISAQVSRAAGELQSAGGQIRKSAANMSDINRQVVVATGEQATQSRMVVKEVQEMNSLTSQVSRATVEQKKGSASMTTAITKIADVAGGNLEATKKLAATTERLAVEAERLSKVAEVFRT